MKRLLTALPLAAAVALALGPASASAWHKDPDAQVDPAHVIESTFLPSPDITLGDLDFTAAGTAGEPLGADPMAPDSPGPPPNHTFIVDNTPLNGDCPNANYTTIQSAVNASGPGDKIKVCPGVYPEQVRIIGPNHDGLTLESLQPLAAIIQWPTVESFPLALVDINDADRVTLRKFTIRGPYTFGGCSPDRHEGVLVDNGFDERIEHNHITEIRNSLPSMRGCQEGDAVSIGRRTPVATPGSARVEHNVIDEYQKNGVQAINSGTSAEIEHNTITGPGFPAQPYAAPNGVVVFGGAVASVEHNIISRNHWTGGIPLSTGIILDEAPAGTSDVSHNRLFDNDYGIESDTQMGLAIEHNDVFDHLADGITLCGETTFFCGPAEQNVVRSNDVTDNDGYGIVLFGADSNLIKSNHVDRNGVAAGDATDGLRADMNSNDNQILDNHMDENLTHDCHDDSVGAGTGGTANTWRGDHGETQNRAGLCS
jgi:parallel beta-helix repeat protein